MAFACALGLALLVARPSRAEEVLAQISVPVTRDASSYYSKIYRFPGDVREYRDDRLFGFSFREDRRAPAVREIQAARVRTPGAYLMVTDLYSDGRFSSMTHSVVMPFPRDPVAPGRWFDVVEQPDGRVRLAGPAGVSLVMSGGSGALFSAEGIHVSPPGARGVPARIRTAGLSLEIRVRGKSPFLRGTPVAWRDGRGRSCEMTTSELFEYARGEPESDRFRFDRDDDLFAWLGRRCPSLTLPAPANRPVLMASAVVSAPTAPAAAPSVAAPDRRAAPPRGTLPYLWHLLARR